MDTNQPAPVNQFGQDDHASSGGQSVNPQVNVAPPPQVQSPPPPNQAPANPVPPPQTSPPPQDQAPPPPDPNLDPEPYDPIFPGYLRPPVEELIYEWDAPSRPFKQHNRRYFTTMITIVLLVSLILLFAGMILPIAVVIAVAFLAYVMASIPPHQIVNQITTYGIRIEDNLYFWDEIGRFWITNKYNQEVFNAEVVTFPYRIVFLTGNADSQDLRAILSEVLIEEQPELTIYEKMSGWLQEKIPLDIEG